MKMSSQDRKRKVRKGTHSCWQCRRRKIRCEFKSESDQVCNGCKLRGTSCVSQEYAEEKATGAPERRLAQRLGRLEELMVQLTDQMGPNATLTEDDIRSEPPDASRSIDVLESSVAQTIPLLSFFGVTTKPPASMPTPASDGDAAPAPPAKYEKIRRTLHSLFPTPQDMELLARTSLASHFLLLLFYTHSQLSQGHCPTPQSLTSIPDVSSHPAVLARGLLRVVVFLQQLPPTFDVSQLNLKKSIKETIDAYASVVANLVTSVDDLVGCTEGLECLILQGLYQANEGNLRKSWLSFRRALSLGQLMGLEGVANHRALPSFSTGLERAQLPLPERLWFRVIFCDRYQSLVLGLPAGTMDNTFAREELLVDDSPMDKLEKLYTVISGRIIERNAARAAQAYALTQSIDCELEVAAKTMGTSWWEMPVFKPEDSPQESMRAVSHMMLQIYHHNLLVVLHLPYMMRDPAEYRFEYSKNTCMQASRDVVRRSIAFRAINSTSYCCRHVDFCAFLSAMTLVLGNLCCRRTGPETAEKERQRCEDRKLVEQVKDTMCKLSRLNQDQLSEESADMLTQLLAMLDRTRGQGVGRMQTGMEEEHPFQLNVPYLGTVNINPSFGASPRPAMTRAHNSQQITTPGTPSSSASVNYSAAFDTLSNPSLFLSFGANEGLNDMNMMFRSNSDLEGSPSAEMDHQDPAMAFPSMTADASDWTFQGVDTAYWTLLNSGMRNANQF